VNSKACKVVTIKILRVFRGKNFDFGHPWSQPSGRLSFENSPIRFSMPNCGCGEIGLQSKIN